MKTAVAVVEQTPAEIMVLAMKTMGFNPHGSNIVAVQRVQEIYEDAKDPLSAMNRIITTLGCTAVLHNVQARILAKTLTQEFVVRGGLYEAEEAMKIAAAKYIDVEKTMPFLFVASEGGVTPITKTVVGSGTRIVKEAKAKRGGDKKERALMIFNTYVGKEVADSDIAKDIAKQLDITFANAYYYVTRVFKKKFTTGATKVKKAKRR